MAAQRTIRPGWPGTRPARPSARETNGSCHGSSLIRASGMASTADRGFSRRSLRVLSRRLRNSLHDLMTVPRWILLKHPRRPPERDTSLEGSLEKRSGKAKPLYHVPAIPRSPSQTLWMPPVCRDQWGPAPCHPSVFLNKMAVPQPESWKGGAARRPPAPAASRAPHKIISDISQKCSSEPLPRTSAGRSSEFAPGRRRGWTGMGRDRTLSMSSSEGTVAHCALCSGNAAHLYL
jgi:hypothetical protein